MGHIWSEQRLTLAYCTVSFVERFPLETKMVYQDVVAQLAAIVEHRLSTESTPDVLASAAVHLSAVFRKVAWPSDDVRDLCEYAVDELIHGDYSNSAPSEDEYRQLLVALRRAQADQQFKHLWWH